jgi:hypothetical protein
MTLTDYRYLWLDEAGVPHTQPIIGCSASSSLPSIKLLKGKVIPPGGSPTSALIAPDGHCWAWNHNDDGEWNTIEEAVAALRQRMGKPLSKPVLKMLKKLEAESEPAE